MTETAPEFHKALEDACAGLERCDRELAAAFAMTGQSAAKSSANASPSQADEASNDA